MQAVAHLDVAGLEVLGALEDFVGLWVHRHLVGPVILGLWPTGLADAGWLRHFLAPVSLPLTLGDPFFRVPLPTASTGPPLRRHGVDGQGVARLLDALHGSEKEHVQEVDLRD